MSYSIHDDSKWLPLPGSDTIKKKQVSKEKFDFSKNDLLEKFKHKGLYLFTSPKCIGKSTLLVQTVLDFTFSSTTPIDVGIISLQLCKCEWMKRFITNVTDSTLEHVEKEIDRPQFLHYEDELGKHIHIRHSYNFHSSLIDSTIEYWILKNNIKMVFIDSLEMLENDQYKSTTVRNNYHAKLLKELSQKYKIPFLVSFKANEFELHSAFSQYFDVITTLKRAEYYQHDFGETDLNIVKNNFGKLKKTSLYFLLNQQKIKALKLP